MVLIPTLALYLLAPSLTAQSTWYVDPSGAGDFVTIQSSLDSALVVAGDTVMVRSGTYFENINLNGKSIELRGEMGANATIVDGQQLGTVVTCDSGETRDTVISGFTFTNGIGLIWPQGGGMYCSSSSPTFEDCVFSHNNSYFGGGASCHLASPLILRCTFESNTGDYGGGMSCFMASPDIEQCLFTLNYGVVSGGGINCHTMSSATLRDCQFIDNYAVYGGGADFRMDSHVTMLNCVFANNSGDLGGGLRFCYSTPYIENCRFENNSATDVGGGVYSVTSFPTLKRCSFRENQAGNGGGGMSCFYSDATLIQCDFSANHCSSNGGALFCDQSNPTLNRCTIVGNSADNRGGALYCNQTSPNVLISSSVLWSNQAPNDPETYGVAGVTYSVITGGWPGTGNLDANPMFRDAENADFRLQETSPCIDAADPADANDPDGTAADIGVCYFHQGEPTLLLSDVIAGGTAQLSVHGMSVDGPVRVAYSLTGGGPTSSRWGDVWMTPPFVELPTLTADFFGEAKTEIAIPPATQGVEVWMQALDLRSETLSSGAYAVVD